ncbi:MAG: ABC transporter ATP-binding protein [Pelosinus sp.]|nr:ABC transporter ATP-binding protein [Pelosinus sp.]
METILAVQDIKKSYGAEDVLAGISFTVHAGEMLSIVGHSGVGKTTLLSIIGLLQSPTAGQITLQGSSAGSLDSTKRAVLRSQYIGFVFQRARLVGSLTALENVLLPTWLFGEKKEVKTKAEDLLCQLGLKERLHYSPAQLSLGQMRRVALARALLLNPSLILADEPTNDLDSTTSEVVFNELQQAKERGAAVILVTHEKEYAARADRMFRLANGLLHEESVLS